MSKLAAFWDTSALVPLCVYQPTSHAARLQHRRFLKVVWWATIVEVGSAFSRLNRQSLLTPAERLDAHDRLQMLAASWSEVTPSESVRELAAELLDQYPLRAADSLQLAAALTWCREKPQNRPFVCADQHLGEAAASAGFAVIALT